MKIKFTKMQGCGNDYVYINGISEEVPVNGRDEIVRKLSDRHFGIGSDGLVLILPSEIAAQMVLFLLTLLTLRISRWRCGMQTVPDPRCAATVSDA